MEAEQAAEKPVPSRRSQVMGGLVITAVTLIIMLGGVELAGYLW
ncbi:MAG: hypothetical protein ACE5EY_14950 [Anaerolineae bacterium]